MTKLNVKDIDFTIVKEGHDVIIKASLGDLFLGSKIYKFETRDRAKKRAIDHIKKYGSLN
jgi:hypothetical protein